MTYHFEELGHIAQEILMYSQKKEVALLLFSGDLGAGKTTVIQILGKLLGVTETIQSPTFSVLKRYALSSGIYDNFIHMDAYRIEDEELELAPLSLDTYINKKNLVCIEWPEKLPQFLKKFHALAITLSGQGDMRTIELYEKK